MRQLRVKGIKKLILFLSLLVTLLLATGYWSLATASNEISARAAVVIDSASEKILYGKNPNLKLPPASTAKLVTAMVALDRLNPDSIVTISENAANTLSVSPHLMEGERYSVRDLLYLALMRSVNSAAVALAEAVAGSEDAFVSMMNDKAIYMGAENTRFMNASGLPGPDQYITTFDLAIIMKKSLGYLLISEIINTRVKEIFSESGRRIFVKNTNQLLWMDEENIGGKTGYTRAAGHCFVGAARRDQNILITAVLGESVRDNVRDITSLLLSKGHKVLIQRSEPMIYFSSIKKSPVVFASYNTDKSKKSYKNKRSKNIKAAKLSNEKQKVKQKVKKIKTAKKHDLKKNKNSNTENKKGKKTLKKNLSVHNSVNR
jgi:D-alanyl-D-alanine carboxypeptidase (penicillin-binding protein 5/6)